ncbi:hypothetical protein VVR12_03375 [Rothia sp. LK2588]|uniref:hypothetical protein n=1 Tax=Rothia sp. LK2588 TaxID=3114369 RepID=UPI0034CF43CD
MESIPPTPKPTPVLIPNGSPLDYSRTGVVWLDMTIDVAVCAVVVIVAVTTAYRVFLKPKIDVILASANRAAENSAVARAHTENNHAGAPNPNLRDDLDAKHTEVLKRLDQVTHTMVRYQERTDAELGNINKTLIADREETRAVRQELNDHIRQKAGLEQRVMKIECDLEDHRENTEG